MSQGYPLLFPDRVYADMVQYGYDTARWMQMNRVLEESTQIPRSKKKLLELYRKGVLLIGDTMTMTWTGTDGVTVSLSATIVEFDHYGYAKMTTSQAGHTHWLCDSPQTFLQFMIGVHPNVKITTRNTWDLIVVVRNGQQLGTLQEVRQCFQLWKDETEKWGCNGLGEQLPDRNAPPQDGTSTAT